MSGAQPAERKGEQGREEKGLEELKRHIARIFLTRSQKGYWVCPPDGIEHQDVETYLYKYIRNLIWNPYRYCWVLPSIEGKQVYEELYDNEPIQIERPRLFPLGPNFPVPRAAERKVRIEEPPPQAQQLQQEVERLQARNRQLEEELRRLQDTIGKLREVLGQHPPR